MAEGRRAMEESSVEISSITCGSEQIAVPACRFHPDASSVSAASRVLRTAAGSRTTSSAGSPNCFVNRLILLRRFCLSLALRPAR